MDLLYLLGFAGDVVVQVCILFLLILVGFTLFKTKLINHKGMKQLIDILFYAVTPCVVINAFQSVQFSLQSALELGIAVIFTVVSIGIGYIFCLIFFRKAEGRRRSVLWYATIYSNCAFFSIPLTQAVLGEKGVFLVSIYVAIFMVFIWTAGLKLFTTEQKVSLKKAVINPGTIGILIGLPLFLLSAKMPELQLPEILSMPIEMLSNLNTPLAMIVTGGYLAMSSLKPQKGDGQMWLSILLRMIVIPAASFGLFLVIFKITGMMDTSREALVALMIPAAAPAAANTIMFAGKYDGDTHLATRSVLMGTLVSIISMPLILVLAML